MCDSILTPSEYGGLFAGERLGTNAFAPLFVGKVDFVAGNPPWVAWDNLPPDYRNLTKDLWRRLGLFTLKGGAARLGGGKKDISMLMLYVAAESYLKDAGKLGFVITQTLFQTKGAGDGFRRFRIGESGAWLGVLHVNDMVRLQPFGGAANWTSTIILQKGAKTSFPVPYTKWTLVGELPGDHLERWESSFAREECEAYPIDKHKLNSPWHVRPKSLKLDVAGLTGPSEYVGHAGAYSGRRQWRLLGANSSTPPRRPSRSECRGEEQARNRDSGNDARTGFALSADSVVERSRYAATPSVYVILTQDPATRAGIAETRMRREYPKTYQYMKGFEKTLRARGSSSIRALMESGPFYSMFAVGTYTLAPTKIVWRRMDRRITAAVVEEIDDPHLGKRPAIPQETCVLIDTRSASEAHYLCAILNQRPGQFHRQIAQRSRWKGVRHAQHARLSKAASLHGGQCASRRVGRPKPQGAQTQPRGATTLPTYKTQSTRLPLPYTGWAWRHFRRSRASRTNRMSLAGSFEPPSFVLTESTASTRRPWTRRAAWHGKRIGRTSLSASTHG